MNAWKSIILVGAALAIAAPTAGATLDRSTPAKVKHAKVVKVTKVAKSKVGKTIVAKNHPPKVSTVRSQPLYIYVSGPATLSPSASSSDDCMTSGNNCTDQQLCDIWGMNCDLVAAPQYSDGATESQNSSG